MRIGFVAGHFALTRAIFPSDRCMQDKYIETMLARVEDIYNDARHIHGDDDEDSSEIIIRVVTFVIASTEFVNLTYFE